MSIRKGDTMIAGSKYDKTMDWVNTVDVTSAQIQAGFAIPINCTIVAMFRNTHNPAPSGKDYNLKIMISRGGVDTEVLRLYTRVDTNGQYRPLSIQMTANQGDVLKVVTADGNISNLEVLFCHIVPWKQN